MIPKYTIDGMSQIVVKTKRIVVFNTPRYVLKFPFSNAVKRENRHSTMPPIWDAKVPTIRDINMKLQVIKLRTMSTSN